MAFNIFFSSDLWYLLLDIGVKLRSTVAGLSKRDICKFVHYLQDLLPKRVDIRAVPENVEYCTTFHPGGSDEETMKPTRRGFNTIVLEFYAWCLDICYIRKICKLCWVPSPIFVNTGGPVGK